MLDEFKKFILKGNMIDLAVGVIIGGAFGKVVEKFSEFLMSIVGWILKTLRLSENALNFDTQVSDGIKWGAVITATINLCLVGFALFLFIKAYNKWLLRPVPAAASSRTTEEVKLLTEIRDALRK